MAAEESSVGICGLPKVWFCKFLGCNAVETVVVISQSESSGDYIVVYLVYHVPAAIQYAKRLAREMACRVRVISSGAGFFRCRRLHQDSPIEFLNLIRHAGGQAEG